MRITLIIISIFFVMTTQGQRRARFCPNIPDSILNNPYSESSIIWLYEEVFDIEKHVFIELYLHKAYINYCNNDSTLIKNWVWTDPDDDGMGYYQWAEYWVHPTPTFSGYIKWTGETFPLINL